jgi:N-acetylneuraminic acid mutarotase
VPSVYQGRIYVVGGCHADRKTTATSHWSLAVSQGKAMESSWVREADSPLEGTHRGSAIIGDYLYLPGGQIGETPPIEGDSTYRYDVHTGTEDVFPDVARYHFKDRKWSRIAPLPVPVSHHDCTTLVVNEKLVVVGGMEFQDPNTHDIFLTDAIQVYDPATDSWSRQGELVYRTKSMVCAHSGGKLYVFGGQRDRNVDDARPNLFLNTIWATSFSPN